MTEQQAQLQTAARSGPSWRQVYWSVILFTLLVLILLWTFSWYFTPAVAAAGPAPDRGIAAARSSPSCT